MSSSVRAVLFDLDGTLLDTLEDLATSMNFALRAHGWPPRTTAEYRLFVGEGVEELARRAAPPGIEGPARAALVESMRRHYEANWAQRTSPYPGVPELLDELSRREIKLAVLSNKLEEFTRAMVAHFLGRWRFAAVVGASSRFPRKPAPSAALAIAAELQVSPEAFLYLGDTAIDMRTANAAGMLAVGATWGFRDADELREGGARCLLDDPLELVPLVDGAPLTLRADTSR